MLKTRTIPRARRRGLPAVRSLGSKAPHGAATVAVPAREGPLLGDVAAEPLRRLHKVRRRFRAARARGAGLRAHAQGRRPWLRPRGGGLKICPPAGGRIAVEGEEAGGEGGDGRACRPSSRRRAAARRRRRAGARCRARCRRRPGRARRSRRAATTTRTRGPSPSRSPCRARRRRARGAASASRASRPYLIWPSTARARPCAWSRASAWRCTIRYPWVRLISTRRRRGPSNSLGALPNSPAMCRAMGSPTRSPSPQRRWASASAETHRCLQTTMASPRCVARRAPAARRRVASAAAHDHGHGLARRLVAGVWSFPPSPKKIRKQKKKW